MVDGSPEVPVFVSPGIRKTLVENGIDLAEALRREGYNVSTRLAADGEGSEGHKDVALILVASAAVITAATPVLIRIIEALSPQSVVLKRRQKQETLIKGLGLEVRYRNEST
jgi:hypothetical protein